MKKEQIVSEIMAAVEGARLAQGMAETHEGEARAEYCHLAQKYRDEAERLLNIHIKDRKPEPYNVGQCWNCIYRADVLMCQYRDYFMEIKQYCQCPEWKGEKG